MNRTFLSVLMLIVKGLNVKYVNQPKQEMLSSFVERFLDSFGLPEKKKSDRGCAFIL